MQRFVIRFYYNDYTIVMAYFNHTKRELSYMMRWYFRLHNGKCCVALVEENNKPFWEFRFNPNDGLYFKNLKAVYGKSYVTKIYDV